MKRLKYAVILLLGLSMVTTMTSCKKDNSQLIVGKWEVVHYINTDDADDSFDPSNIDPSMYGNYWEGAIWEFSSNGVVTINGERHHYSTQGDVLTVDFIVNFEIYKLTNSSLIIWYYFNETKVLEYYELKKVG